MWYRALPPFPQNLMDLLVRLFAVYALLPLCCLCSTVRQCNVIFRAYQCNSIIGQHGPSFWRGLHGPRQPRICLSSRNPRFSGPRCEL
ncbi:hypothetical protein BGZ63DRAFT_372700 [Mariannaea sp. PMI_226]|nr:hypothetical protein BGZ63DRAFT_372700 [Mariannaea sp. PMI_226]